MSGILFLLVAVLIGVAGSIFFYNLMPDFQKLNLSRRFDDKLGVGRKPPGLFSMFRLPILMLDDFASELKAPGLRERYQDGIRALGLEEMVTVNQAIALKITLTLVMTLYGLIMFGIFPIATLLLPVFGWFFMDIWFRDKVAQRKAKIKRELPFVLDTLTLAVEAGLEFTQAMNRIVTKMGLTPLRDELMVFLRQMQLGTSRKEALKNLAVRTEIREVGSMVSALIQASEMGASIGGALRIQSEIMSAERFQVAEKKGAEASQKMLIPMMIFIVPAIMLVILGPIAVQWVYGITS